MTLQLMNAAGTVKTPDKLRKAAQIESLTELSAGSYTLPQRKGNEGKQLFFYDEIGRISLNSLGIPNGGIEYLRAQVSVFYEIARLAGKTLRVSISGTPHEIEQMSAVIAEISPDIIIEVNGSCPNIWLEESEQKPMAGFVPLQIRHLVIAARAGASNKNQVAIKLPLYSNPANLDEVGDELVVLHKEGHLHEVVYSNTYANSFLWDMRRGERGEWQPKQAIDYGDGLAGGAGPAIIAFVLGGWRQFNKKFASTNLLCTGAGGACNGWSIAQYVLTGIERIQINTNYYNGERPQSFGEMLTDFADTYPELAEQHL